MTNSMGTYLIEVYPVIYTYLGIPRDRGYFPFQRDMDWDRGVYSQPIESRRNADLGRSTRTHWPN